LTAGDGFSTDTETKTAYITVNASTSNACDTLHNVGSGDTLALYYDESNLYWTGHNSWLDMTYAEYFDSYQSGYQLTGVMLGFGVGQYSSTTSKLKVKVWDNTGTNGSPGQLLASKNLKLSQIATDVTNGQYSTVTFNTPISLSTPYFVGIELTYTSGDTVAIYTNTVFNGKPNTAWVQTSDSSWYEFGDLWGYGLSYLMLPVMCPAGSAPVAEFTANTTTVYVGNSVDFTDLSTNSPTSWSWSFTGGSPTSSTVQNPTGVVYNTAGTYQVSLTATNSYGSDTETKTAYVTVVDTTTIVTTEADFVANATTVAVGGSVDFTDLSTGNPTSWSWTFTGGSPSSSSVQNPSGVVYNTAGLYTVELTASGLNGSDTETKTNYINVVVVPIICDTLANVDLALDTPAIYPLSGGGYVSGHNYYYDIAKAEYFSNYMTGSELTEVMLWFGVAEYSSTSSKVTVKVWDNTGSNGEPGNVLASETVTIASIASDIAQLQLTDVIFTTPAAITTPYYVGFEFSYKAGDTVALVHNSIGETVPGTAWEEWSDYTWWNYNDANSWGIDVAHYVFPIVCYEGTITTLSNVNAENHISVYPNPNAGNFKLTAIFEQSSDLNISVINMLGELVFTTSYSNVMAGNFDVDMSNQSNGVYYIKAETNNETIVKQIVISK
jgi:PKD repeat protein